MGPHWPLEMLQIGVAQIELLKLVKHTHKIQSKSAVIYTGTWISKNASSTHKMFQKWYLLAHIEQ